MNSNSITANGKIDLHMHSYVSDGLFSPTELVSQVAAQKIELFSLTDHDTFGGVEEAMQEAKLRGIKFIKGVEISALFSGGCMHILSYGFNHKDQEFIAMLDRVIDHRNKRNGIIINKLQELGIDISKEELAASVGETNKTVGRPHIAELLIKKGVVSTFNEAFDSYLGFGKAAYVCKEIYTQEEILSAIHAAGGLSFLAHPITLNIEDEEELAKKLTIMKEQGLDGIEILNSCQNLEFTTKLLRLSKRLDLLKSAGSDYHGFKSSRTQLGRDCQGSCLTFGKISPELLELAE